MTTIAEMTEPTVVPTVRTTFVEFNAPGSFFPENGGCEVASRNPSDLMIPDRAFAFRFFDKEVGVISVAGITQAVKSDEIDPTGRYYIDATVFDLPSLRAFAEASEKPRHYEILISNMECNGWDLVVRCRSGNWQPFTRRDRLFDTVTGIVTNPREIAEGCSR